MKVTCARENFEETDDEDIAGCSSDLDLLFDPDRHVGKEYSLYQRSDAKNVPKSVKRCQSCERSFTEVDILVVKTEFANFIAEKANKKEQDPKVNTSHQVANYWKNWKF